MSFTVQSPAMVGLNQSSRERLQEGQRAPALRGKQVEHQDRFRSPKHRRDDARGQQHRQRVGLRCRRYSSSTMPLPEAVLETRSSWWTSGRTVAQAAVSGPYTQIASFSFDHCSRTAPDVDRELKRRVDGAPAKAKQVRIVGLDVQLAVERRVRVPQPDEVEQPPDDRPLRGPRRISSSRVVVPVDRPALARPLDRLVIVLAGEQADVVDLRARRGRRAGSRAPRGTARRRSPAPSSTCS